MLAEVAEECRRWMNGVPGEIALVVPVANGGALPAVAIARGGPSAVQVAPERVLRIALAAGADQLVVAHNHPRNGGPSAADLAVTRRLVAAGGVVGISVLAHIVLIDSGWYDCCGSPSQLRRWATESAA